VIVQAAWQLRHSLLPKPDCSHFVHAIYTQAGFLYAYAASRTIFSGIDGFRRVTKPQSGDVIVWQGHIGIVIDPKEHSFYSSVTAGFAIQSYQSRYWAGRGIARFYRFVVNDRPEPAPVLANLDLPKLSSGKVLSALMQPFPAQPPILMQSDTPQLAAQADASKRPAPESAQVRLAQPQEQQQVVEDRPLQVQAGEAGKNNTEIADQVVITSRQTPAKKEVLAAIRRLVNANGEGLLQAGSLNSQPAVGLVDRMKVLAIDLQGDSAFADVEIRQVGEFEYGKAIATRTKTVRQVILSRHEQGWVLAMPQDLMCVNRNLAVTALTDHLATLPQTPANSRELKTTRRILSALSSERKLWHPRTWFRLARSSKPRSSPEMES
jgi:hypothetical protein